MLNLCLAGLAAPFFFKEAVDQLLKGSASVQACIAGLIFFGFTRLVSQCAKELQGPLFTPIGQARSNW
jgi:hypothetical protein